MKTGVYIIWNILNNKFYIGSSAVNISDRWAIHRYQLNTNTHVNKHLQRAWNKYGKINFVFLVLELVEPEKCIECEQYYIDYFNPDYNILRIAGSCLGYKRSIKSRKLQSKRLKGRKCSEIHKLRVKLSKIGTKHSEETKRKMSKSGKNRKFTKTHRRNLSLALSGRKQSQDHINKRVASIKKLV